MTQLSDWKRKATLLFKSEKKLGASAIVTNYANKSYNDMMHVIITEDDIDLDSLVDTPRIKDLSKHLNKVKNEFINHSELCFYHATLIVLIRRGYKIQETFAEFENLWEKESDFLLDKLSLRWIISACDTFIDHSNSVARSSILMNAVTLVNTVKVYETEKYLRGFQNYSEIDDKNTEALYAKHLHLYAGLTYFRIGSDDTLKNMRTRYKKFGHVDRLATEILLSVFDKLQNLDTAFSLVKNLHRDEKSEWWI